MPSNVVCLPFSDSSSNCIKFRNKEVPKLVTVPATATATAVSLYNLYSKGALRYLGATVSPQPYTRVRGVEISYGEDL
jgi:hypothetical protein